MKATSTRPSPYAAEFVDRWLELVDDAVSSWSEWAERWSPRRVGTYPECRPVPCEPPSRGDCHCDCCIGDADMVVETRVGEMRVVPVAIENPTRREATVRVELGDFHGRRGQASVGVEASVEPDDELRLGPCEQRDVVIRLAVRLEREKDQADVAECEVLYGDLNLIGCDRRPIRIAVAVLPRDCGLLTVDCRCSCC